MPIVKPQVVVWLVPSAPFRALFLILNEDRNEYINDTVTVELSLRSGTRFTGKAVLTGIEWLGYTRCVPFYQ